jgi:beta-glucanase (GH16 family)
MAQNQVSNGLLTITAQRTSPTTWVSGLIDTKSTWTQLYGTFEARIKAPRGPGLWPAFWSYYSVTGFEAEIDAMEICANPVGMNNGNDVTLLHQVMHWTNAGSAGRNTRTVDLSEDFHVYGVDWRADHISFYLDGIETWRFTDVAHIPNVPLPLILDLAVGGAWCGPSDATTPDGSQMLVDWVRARP